MSRMTLTVRQICELLNCKPLASTATRYSYYIQYYTLIIEKFTSESEMRGVLDTSAVGLGGFSRIIDILLNVSSTLTSSLLPFLLPPSRLSYTLICHTRHRLHILDYSIPCTWVELPSFQVFRAVWGS